jgi:putative DNA primase/helicase
VSYDAAVADFIGAMALEGIKPVDPIAGRLSGGELIRFRCYGDGPGRKNGWAILYLDGRPAGAFGNYRMGIDRRWKAGATNQLSRDELERLKDEWREAKERRIAERHQSAAEAALDAAELWDAAQPADPEHQYLQRKRIAAYGVRQHRDTLLVPMLDTEGRIRNLQRIKADGSKRFLKGGQCEGLFYLIGRIAERGQTVCLGEGFSTMAAVHQSTCFAAIVAFSLKNLVPVARIWRDLRPDLDFVICADDDQHLIDHPQIRRNLGLETAQAVAAEIGARLAVPTGRAA